jgi:hypothetical protein
VPAAVLDVPLIVPPAVDPVLPTALDAEGLAPDSPEATLPATPLTVEPTFAPVLAIIFDTVPVTGGTGGTGVTTHPAPLQPGGTLTLGDGLEDDGVFGWNWDPPGGDVPGAGVPVRPARPAGAAAPGVPATAPTRAVAASRSRFAWEGGATFDCDTATATGVGGLPTAGQPRKATIALASRNIAAAPATSDPEVPNPARYARVARTLGRYRTSGVKPLAPSRRAPGSSEALHLGLPT